MGSRSDWNVVGMSRGIIPGSALIVSVWMPWSSVVADVK
jgi:hypothetical protein